MLTLQIYFKNWLGCRVPTILRRAITMDRRIIFSLKKIKTIKINE